MTKNKAQSVFTATDITIANNLRKYSTIKGFTIKQIAGITDVCYYQASKYFKGQNRIPNSRLSKICLHFDLTVNDFIRENENIEIVLNETEIREKHLIFKLLKHFSKLQDFEMKLSVVTMLENFSKHNSKYNNQK